MNLAKGIFGLIATVWIAAAVAYSVSGPAVVEGSEIIAAKMTEDTGIREQVTMVRNERCRQHQENYDRLWERSIDKGMPESMEPALERARISVEEFCQQ